MVLKRISPPGKFGHPILGNLKDLRLRVLDFFCSLQEVYGDCTTIRFSIRKVTYIQNPDIIQHVLQENNRNYTKSLRYEQLRYLLGNGLLTSEGEYWLRQRRMVQPGFHKERIQSLFEKMVLCTEELISKWRQVENYQSVNVAPDIMSLTLQIVGKTLLNANVKSDAKVIAEALGFLLNAVNKRTRTPVLLPIWIPTPHHLKIKKAVNDINSVLIRIFEQRRTSETQFNDLLTMLMEARYEDTGKPMSDKQLRDEVMTLFVAGHETTANAICWTLHLLSLHEEVYNKCKEEINQVLKGDSLNFMHLQSLKYLTMVIEESMRLYPPAWIIGRKTIEPDVLGNYKVGAGHNVLICPYALHRDKRFWPDPELFNPERFTVDEIKKRPKFAYIPFGGGPRMCIGNNFAMMEMQIVMALLIQAFQFKPNINKPVKTDALITLRPANGMHLIITNN